MKIKSNFYQNNGKNIIGALIIAIISVIVLISIMTSNVKVQSDGLKVTSIPSLNLKYTDIIQVSLKDNLPNNFHKSVGIDLFGVAYIGNFTSDELGKLKVFVHSKNAPYIYIETKNNEYNYVILNQGNKTETKALYDSIVSKIKK